jgi:hypothetical protein
MFTLINKRSHMQSEAHPFFNESPPSRWAGTLAGLLAVTIVASAIVMLVTV